MPSHRPRNAPASLGSLAIAPSAAAITDPPGPDISLATRRMCRLMSSIEPAPAAGVWGSAPVSKASRATTALLLQRR
jgi:hypothetical protein